MSQERRRCRWKTKNDPAKAESLFVWNPAVPYSPGRSPAAVIAPGNSHSRGFAAPCDSQRSACLFPPLAAAGSSPTGRYRQVLCANSFTSLAELRLHRAGEPALDCPIAEGRVSVKGGEAACEALDAGSGFCYQPAASSCTSRCFILMYFFPPHWVPAT